MLFFENCFPITLLVVLLAIFALFKYLEVTTQKYLGTILWKCIFYVMLGIFSLINIFTKYDIIDFDAIVAFLVFVEAIDNWFDHWKKKQDPL
jgi:hypothetical protein